MRLIYLLLIQGVYSFNLIGNKYSCKFSVPFIKTQSVYLTYLNNNEVRVKLIGFINKVKDIYYSFDNDNIVFNQDNEIDDIMLKYYICLNSAEYNKETDVHTITLQSSILPFKKTINLKRT